jgi:hypothetical protein
MSKKGLVLPVGDVLLAQKLALELFEVAALKVATRRCANRLPMPLDEILEGLSPVGLSCRAE